jgi:Tol biopolymer transport system component
MVIELSRTQHMSGLIGRRLGVYQVETLLGSGGMGEVYRARDTRLGRDVAIKILPAVFTAEPHRLARFEREAQVLASLNHPHIGAIYGFEEGEAGPEGSTRALVLELVEGDTLEAAIAKGTIAVGQALAIAAQIADALDAAHEKGIVHRDLKPANVKISPDGVVKVLDFGLAKTSADVPSELTQTTTITRATRVGVILGTAAYMSPEQARGLTVDKRTDIWAFGCVLYEMLTGRRAFVGETMSDTIAAILEREPDWTMLPHDTPSAVARLLRRALEKQPKLRLRDIGDARFELAELTASPGPAPGAAGGAHRRAVVPWLAGLVVAVLAGGLGYYGASRQPLPGASAAATHFAVELPLAAPQLDRGRGNHMIALSPDGRHLALFARSIGGLAQLWVRSLDGLESRLLTGTEGGFDPFFSPDSRWIGYFQDQRIKKVLVTGGEPLTVCDLPSAAAVGASWAADDTILFTPSPASGLWQVPAAGGVPSPVLTDAGVEYRWPQVLPGAGAVLFASADPAAPGSTARQIQVQSLDTKARRVLTEGTGGFFANGHVIFLRENSILAARLDLESLQLGPALPLIDRVSPLAAGLPITLSHTGSLAYVPPLGQPDGTLAWVDRSGTEQPLAAPVRPYRQPRLSPDRRLLAVTIEPVIGSENGLWVYDLSRGVLTQATTGGRVTAFPVWRPDGRLTYQGGQGMYSKAIEGSGPEESISASGLPMSWAPDGRTLSFVRIDQSTLTDIWLLPFDHLGAAQAPRPIVQSRSREGGAAFSPDGRWLAYISNETGRNEIHVRAIAAGGGQHQISIDGGNEVVWPPRSRELFYRNGETIMAVEVTTMPRFAAGKPRPLFKGSFMPSTALWANYDVTADGQRFLMIKPATPAQARPQAIHMLLNWQEELSRRAGHEAR